MNKTLLEIFTPTYNRCNNLEKLYQSILEQNNPSISWIIVDDGSSDNTKIKVNQWIKENKIKIKYIKKDNGGKFSTFNVALSNCNAKYICCIDSDDYLRKGEYDKMLDYMKLKDMDSSIGIVFPRYTSTINYDKLSKFNKKLIDIMDLKFIGNINIETTIIIRCDELKKVNLNTCKGERFKSEEIIYNELSKRGKFIYINEPIVFSEYEDGGLTKNLYKNYLKSFNSTIELYKSRYEFLNKYNFIIRLVNKLKTIINLNALCLAKKKNIYKYTPNILCSFICLPFSYIWRLRKYE